MSRTASTLGAAGIGALAAFILDPSTGRRRRARLRDRAKRGVSDARHFIDVALRDLGHRVVGTGAELRYHYRGRDTNDDILTRRVGSRLGRLVSHPRAIGVTSSNGHVILRGPVLAQEVAQLVSGVSSVPGVKAVSTELDIHKDASSTPALQGGRMRSPPRPEFLRESWTPALRLLGVVGGAFLLAKGFRRSGIGGAIEGIAGATLAGRALTNLEVRRMIGVSGGRQAFSVQKTIAINAPIDRVFSFFSDFRNFPSFMRYVRDVRDLRDGRSRWLVTGPGGLDISWNAVITRYEVNDVIAWKSERGSTVMHAGIIHFEEVSDQRTRINIEMTYNPPAGVFGHAVAAIFGVDPQKELSEDVLRAKSYLETGHPARDAARRRSQRNQSSLS